MPVELVPAAEGRAAVVTSGAWIIFALSANKTTYYDPLPAHQKRVFRDAFDGAATVTLATIRATPESDADRAAAAAAQAAALAAAQQAQAAETARQAALAAAAAATPHPVTITAHVGSHANFNAWLTAREAEQAAHPGNLRFMVTAAQTLHQHSAHATVTKESLVYIQRNSGPGGGRDANWTTVQHTTFVFHYHPGVAGAGVGHGYASQYHFKPSRSAAFRVLEGEASAGVRSLLTRVKNASGV